jgi:hypothetical protein
MQFVKKQPKRGKEHERPKNFKMNAQLNFHTISIISQKEDVCH